MALPFLLSENRRSQDERPSTVAAVGDLAGALRSERSPAAASPSSSAADPSPAYLPTAVSAETAGAITPATPPTDPPTVTEGRAGFDRWAPGLVATDKPCRTNLDLAVGTTVNVTNLDNGHVASCIVVQQAALPAGQVVVLDSGVFGALADLADAPIPVRVDW